MQAASVMFLHHEAKLLGDRYRGVVARLLRVAENSLVTVGLERIFAHAMKLRADVASINRHRAACARHA
jgi:hypothetical protein